MEFLKRLITARAAIVGLVIAALALARQFGVLLPKESDDLIAQLVDKALLAVAIIAGVATAHHADPPAKSSKAKTTIASLLVLPLLFLASCTATQAMTAAQTAHDAAQQLCALEQAKTRSIDLLQAADDFCTAESALKPYLDLVLATRDRGIVVTRSGVDACQ